MKQLELTGLLRFAGAAMVVGAGLISLIQGFEATDPFTRFAVFFGLVTTLAGAGLFCARRWHETKSARGFLALMTAGIAVQFAQAGAMTYAMVRDLPAASMPKIFVYQGLSLLQTGTALGLIALVLVPLAAVGFRILAGPHAKRLALGFLGASALLLVPTRESLATAVIVVAQLAAALPALRALRDDVVRTRLFETWLSRAILIIPAAIAAGRGLFYDDRFMIGATLAVGAGLLILWAAREMGLQKGPRAFAEFASLILFMLGTLYWGLRLADVLLPQVRAPWNLHVYWTTLPLFLLFFAVERLGLWGRGYFRLAGIGVAMTAMLPMMLAEPMPALLALASGLGLAAWAFVRRDREVFVAGAGLATAAVIEQIVLALRFLSAWPWLTLAILGIAALLLASWLEQRWPTLRVHWGVWAGHFTSGREADPGRPVTESQLP